MKKDSKTKIASTYALALYEGAEERKVTSKVNEDIEKLLVVVKQDKDFIKYLSNPIWTVDSKKEALKEISKKLSLNSETLNCLNVIVDNNRFGEFAEILQGFKQVYYAQNGFVEVEVQSVKVLSTEQDKKLKINLENILNKKVVVNYEIKPELLGGLIVKYNSMMIDDSIKGKLNRLEIMMKGGQ